MLPLVRNNKASQVIVAVAAAASDLASTRVTLTHQLATVLCRSIVLTVTVDEENILKCYFAVVSGTERESGREGEADSV